jgi:hypothetical protein
VTPQHISYRWVGLKSPAPGKHVLDARPPATPVDRGVPMNVEMSLTDEMARSRALAVLKDLGHRAAVSPAGPFSILVEGVAAADLRVVHAVVTSVDRAADAVAKAAALATPMRSAG